MKLKTADNDRFRTRSPPTHVNRTMRQRYFRLERVVTNARLVMEILDETPTKAPNVERAIELTKAKSVVPVHRPVRVRLVGSAGDVPWHKSIAAKSDHCRSVARISVLRRLVSSTKVTN